MSTETSPDIPLVDGEGVVPQHPGIVRLDPYFELVVFFKDCPVFAAEGVISIRF